MSAKKRKGIEVLNDKLQAQTKDNEKKVEILNKMGHIELRRKETVMPTAEALQLFHEATKNTHEEAALKGVSANTIYSDPHKGSRYELRKAYVDENWDQWLYDLLNGQNLLFYGIGCKRLLLYDFINHHLSSEFTLVVEGSNSLSSKYSSSAYLHQCEGESDGEEEENGAGIEGAGAAAAADDDDGAGGSSDRGRKASVVASTTGCSDNSEEEEEEEEGGEAAGKAATGRGRNRNRGRGAMSIVAEEDGQQRERERKRKYTLQKSSSSSSSPRRSIGLGSHAARKQQEQEAAARMEAEAKEKYNIVGAREVMLQLLNTICEEYLELKPASGSGSTIGGGNSASSSSYAEMLCGERQPTIEALVGAVVAEIERVRLRDMARRPDRDPTKWEWEQSSLPMSYGRNKARHGGHGDGNGGWGGSGSSSSSSGNRDYIASSPPLVPNPLTRDLDLDDVESQMQIAYSRQFATASGASSSTAPIPQSRRQLQDANASANSNASAGAATVKFGRYPTTPDLSLPVGQNWAAVRTHSQKNLLFIVVHNIDGDRLLFRDTQFALSQLAACPYVRLLVSCDHLNAPLLWEQNISSHFNWTYVHTPTFVPTAMSFDHYTLNRVKIKLKGDKIKANAAGAGVKTSIAKTSIDSIWTGLAGPHKKILSVILEWYAAGYKRIVGSVKLDLPTHAEIQEQVQTEMKRAAAEEEARMPSNKNGNGSKTKGKNSSNKPLTAKQQKDEAARLEKAEARFHLQAEKLVGQRIDRQKKEIESVQERFNAFLHEGMPIATHSNNKNGGAGGGGGGSRLSGGTSDSNNPPEKTLAELCKLKLITGSIVDLKVRLAEFCDQQILDKAVLIDRGSGSKMEYGKVRFLLDRHEIERYCKLANVSLK